MTESLVAAYKTIIEHFSRDGDFTPADLANYAETANRAAKVLSEITKTKTQIVNELKLILNATFPMEDNASPALIAQGPITVDSLCPHHLLHVAYKCYVAYIPRKQGKVIGLSKLARIAKLLGQRPVLQEQLVNDIADALFDETSNTFRGLESQGSAVHLVGKHSCMSCRGVKDDALTSVAVMRGIFCTGELEQKFYQHIQMINTTKF